MGYLKHRTLMHGPYAIHNLITTCMTACGSLHACMRTPLYESVGRPGHCKACSGRLPALGLLGGRQVCKLRFKSDRSVTDSIDVSLILNLAIFNQ